MKRLIGIFMVLGLIFASTININAATSTEELNIIQAAESILQVALTEPEAYGLENTDINNVSICKAIKPYSLTQEGISQIHNIEYYPLKSGDKIIGNFTVCYDDNGDYTITFDNRFAKELNKYLDKKNDKFVLIQKDGDLFIKNSNSVNKITSSKKVNSSNLSLDVEKSISNTDIILDKLITMEKLALTNRALASSKRINMPYISQGNYGLCWAAASASMGQYYTSTVKTAKYIADTLGIDYDKGGNVDDMRNALKTVYKLNATSVSAPLTFSSLVSCIDANMPIGAGFGTQNLKEGHAVVICGYSYSAQGVVFTVRDSNTSSYMLVYEGSLSGNTTLKMDYYKGLIMYWMNSVYVQ